jgi:transketolase
MQDSNDLDVTCINTIRTLSMDAVQAAGSGHPGTPMAMAPVAYCLWQRFLRFDPQDPIWPNRDRFVLSAGHASMLLYSLLRLTGVKAVSKDHETLGEPSVPLEAIERFRQVDSRCPGHPEYRWTSGVETTTGPLGQGLATSVGMALAGRWMAAHFNRPGFEELIDFNVYALCGDGCMMEGISHEAASLAKNVPWLIGGAADLAPSTKTRLTFEGAGEFQAASPGGRNLHFGTREHAMAAILNGMALVKVRPYGSGFFIFSDYARGALRLSALMELPVIHIFTHDSIGVGEDGPTHQPVEHLASLRAVPGLVVLRPADANEVAEAWKVIMKLHHEPAVLILTRQALPTIDRRRYASAADLARGAYVLADAPDGEPEVLLLASGSEVALCLEAHERLKSEGIKTRVVSMPSWELFDDQPREYRDRVLPPQVTARVSVEQASTFGWARYVGISGHSIGMRSFGASAPLKDLVKKFGFTAEHVVTAAKEQLAGVAPMVGSK